MPELTDIRRTARGSSLRRLYVDGCEWRSIPSEVVRDLGLRVGQEIDADSLEERIAQSEPVQAWQRTLRLLNFRERGSGELKQRLIDDGYSETVVDEAVLRAVDLGFLDDRRFAAGMARSLAEGKGRGRRRIASELSARGVDEALSAEVLEDCCDPESERRRAMKVARKMAASRSLDAPRVASRLVSRGFETSLAWSVAREVSRDLETASDEG